MNDRQLKQKAASGFAYRFAERALAKAISFVIQLLLARLLMPEEYGLIALVTVVITICDVFVTYGFGNALIVNKDSDQLDFSTCFFFCYMTFSNVVKKCCFTMVNMPHNCYNWWTWY